MQNVRGGDNGTDGGLKLYVLGCLVETPSGRHLAFSNAGNMHLSQLRTAGEDRLHAQSKRHVIHLSPRLISHNSQKPGIITRGSNTLWHTGGNHDENGTTRPPARLTARIYSWGQSLREAHLVVILGDTRRRDGRVYT